MSKNEMGILNPIKNITYCNYHKIYLYFYIVGVLDPYSMTLNKRNRSMNIDEPNVGAILQPGNPYNSIETYDSEKQGLDDSAIDEVFPNGYGENLD